MTPLVGWNDETPSYDQLRHRFNEGHKRTSGRVWLATLAVAIFVTGFLLGARIASTDHPGASQRIQEDDPAWNCHTMGNRVCGP